MTRRPRITDRRRRGFSFTEVLFAVMILGIGFIMVAAIFPVAIQQARTSSEETTGAAVSRGAANLLEKVARNSTMPATGLANIVVSGDFDGFPPPAGLPAVRDNFTLSAAVRGSAIVAADPRFGWVPFYRRSGDPLNPDTWSPFAQVIMIPVFARAQSEYVVDRNQSGQLIDRGIPKVLHDVRADGRDPRARADVPPGQPRPDGRPRAAPDDLGADARVRLRPDPHRRERPAG